VVVTELAARTVAVHVGELIAALGVPIAGVILLIIGLQRHSRSRRRPPFPNPMLPPGYPPPPGPYPYGYPPPSGPVNAGYPNQPGPPPPGPYQPAPYPPPYYPAGYPAARPRQSSGTGLIVTGSILLGLGLLGGLARVAEVASTSDHSVRVGQCIRQSDYRDNVINPAPQDCADPNSIFEIAGKGDGSANCPDGKLEDSKYAFMRDNNTTLCLMLNLKQGHCYTATGTPDNPSFAASTCDASGPRLKVVKRSDDSSNVTQCPSGTRAFSYPSPTRLYCLERLEN
jgi:hypothetical protein